jgi:hypothetical protein
MNYIRVKGLDSLVLKVVVIASRRKSGCDIRCKNQEVTKCIYFTYVFTRDQIPSRAVSIAGGSVNNSTIHFRNKKKKEKL